jgi:NAD(P)-dependent dehydrogenase (short-subunit alcohol dehydrogenase family)
MTDDRVALITGGFGGVGLATGARLQADGYRIVAAGRHPPLHPPDGTIAVQLDVRDRASVDAAVAYSCTLGRLVAVVCAHGVSVATPLAGMTEEDLTTTLDINLAGTMRVCRAATERLEDGAAIVNVTSVGALRGFASDGVAYGASKAGIEAITRYYAAGLASRGIRVNSVMPGPLEHTMAGAGAALRSSLGDFQAAVTRLVPLGRPLALREVANAVAFLLSDAASGTTGACLPVEGGMLAR